MPFELVPPGTHIDFIGKRKICALISAGALLAGFLAIFVQGIHLGIDFSGGTELQFQFQGDSVDEGAIRSALSDFGGIRDLSVVRFGSAEDNEFLIRFQNVEQGADEDSGAEVDAASAPDGALLDLAKQDQVYRVEQTLKAAVGPLTEQRVDFVGPRVGSELRRDGLMALLYATLAILAYIAFRFTTRFAPGAILAVVHDLLVTAGIFVILGMEFDLRVLAAMLAILGYSLNDTIIIYDRIRENMELRTSYDLPTVLNQSVNQTLSRTVLTSGTTLLAVAALFVLGGEVIRPFAFAMLIGVVVGTYSSIYIAAPTLMWIEQRYGKS